MYRCLAFALLVWIACGWWFRSEVDPRLVGYWVEESYFWPQLSLKTDGSGYLFQHHWGTDLKWWIQGDVLVLRLAKSTWDEELWRLWERVSGKTVQSRITYRIRSISDDRIILITDRGAVETFMRKPAL